MSGKPHPDGIKRVVWLLAQLEEARTELAALTPERDRLIAKCSELESKERTASADLRKTMEEMDVDSPGNYGWSGRMAWFLAEFRRQLLERRS